MLKKILFPVSLVFAVVLGGVSADFLRNQSAYIGGGVASAKPSYDNKKPNKKKKKDKKKGKKKDKGKDDDSKGNSASSDITYMKFKRQFVIPIMDKGKIKSLVILNINLELDKSAPQSAYTLEPKLRDAIMRELLALSHAGAFSDDLTSAETYDKLRSSLLDASQAVLKKGVKNVLILDLMRQDQ
ncbi:MAG: hypothetical protein COA91_09375 [Robiginitomaculum sp.]|nr:MAG: hypothetical protein COA91_09375 [Robiginitomaculum sp.]